jgi:hypothetical protein
MNRVLICLAALSLALPASTAYTQDRSRCKPPAKTDPCRAIADCPDEGCGARHDPDLNKRKNIPLDDRRPSLKNFLWMKALPKPSHFTSKNRNRDELKQLGEGRKITVVAWAMAARKGGQESCNCKLKPAADTDNHIVLVDPAIKNPTLAKNEKRDSQTAEFTPRVRCNQHPNFTQENLESLIDPDWHSGDTPKKGKLLVRVTGLLMFDSEHFLQNPLKRHNNWEIHPVLRLEYCPEGQVCSADSDENWVDLDSE